jgi:hypothetical protein
MRVVRAADVLEGDAADLVRQQPRLRVQRLQPRVLHLEAAEHLLHEQERIRPDMKLFQAARPGPVQRRD